MIVFSDLRCPHRSVKEGGSYDYFQKIYKLVAVTAVAAMALTGAALATDEVDFSVECPKLRGSVNTIEEGFYGEKRPQARPCTYTIAALAADIRSMPAKSIRMVQLVLGKLATGRASLA